MDLLVEPPQIPVALDEGLHRRVPHRRQGGRLAPLEFELGSAIRAA
jgi:hypothetical protein